MTEKTWFITGASRGFGRQLAIAALARGDRVAASARHPQDLADLAERFGDQVLALQLDVTDARAAESALRNAGQAFGKVDVVVNNAGYANVAPIESTAEEDFRAQFETNFWGVYHVSKAAIPILREQGEGLIVQFSSVGGRVGGSPGIASYQAAKFAVDGFSRVFAVETAPFGISVMVVEPSGFATDWAGSSMTVHEVPVGYEQTVGAMNSRMRQSSDGPAGDPARGARIIVDVIHSGRVPSHLLLGVDAVEMSLAYSRGQILEAAAWTAVSRSADFTEPYPVPLPQWASAEHGEAEVGSAPDIALAQSTRDPDQFSQRP